MSKYRIIYIPSKPEPQYRVQYWDAQGLSWVNANWRPNYGCYETLRKAKEAVEADREYREHHALSSKIVWEDGDE